MMTVCGYLVAKEHHQMAIWINMETYFIYLNSLNDKMRFYRVSDPMTLVEVSA